MICAGIDAGSRTIKIVLIDAEKLQVVAEGLIDQGVEQDKLTSELFEKLLKELFSFLVRVRWNIR